MRSIKFRGKRVDNGGWEYGDLLQNYVHHKSGATINYGGSIVFEVDPSTVGQFTGLHDKDGKEIWEGDVVETEKWVSVGKYARCVGIITYSMTEFNVKCVGDWQGSNAVLNGNATVIGNIHDNPHTIWKEATNG